MVKMTSMKYHSKGKAILFQTTQIRTSHIIEYKPRRRYVHEHEQYLLLNDLLFIFISKTGNSYSR